MSINYIQLAIEPRYNMPETIEWFEEMLDEKSLKLLDGKNVILDPVTDTSTLLGETTQAGFTVYEGTPLIVIFINHMDKFFKNEAPKKALLGSYRTLLKHELIHWHQWERGDLDFKNGVSIWRGQIFNSVDMNPSIEDEFKKPYEVEAYLVSFLCGPLHDKLFVHTEPNSKKNLKLLKQRYIEIFGKPFDRKYYNSLFA